MRIIVLIILLVLAQSGMAIRPVKKWPRVIHFEGKQVVNPSVPICVRADYRLRPANKPDTPPGKRIKNEQFIQDPEDASLCIYDIEYEDIPEPPEPPEPPPPPVITNVAADRVIFRFSTNGIYYGVTWLDAPATNGI